MRNLSAWSIRNPIPPILLFIILLFLGIIAFVRLPINNMPDIAFPAVEVGVSQPGAAPAELETQVLQKIEGAIASVGNVKSMTGVVVEGSASLFIEFQLGTPVDRAMNDVRDAVSKVRSDLPDGIQEPTVTRIENDGLLGYFSVSTTDMTPEQMSWFVDNNITKRLLAIKGVAQVFRGGGVSREIRINLDPARMQALGVTAAQVNTELRQLNLDAPGGRSEIGNAEQAIRVLGGAKTARQLAETQINVSGGRAVKLADIAEVKDGTSEQRQINRRNGREVTGFSVIKGKGYSEVAAMEKIQATFRALETEYPGVKINEDYNNVPYTVQQYDGAIWAMVEGAVLAVLVVWLFLRDWRATLIAALAIPLSAIPAFWIMELMGFTLNTISLLALSLVAGILVDDAIVEIENIVRHMRMGKSAYQAAMDAADEIGLAVVATTMAIIVVFLPVSFMGGIVGQFFKQFGLTVAAAVFMSLLVARMITPLIAAYFLKPHGKEDYGNAMWLRKYLDILRWSINSRKHAWAVTLGGGIFFLGAAIVLATIIPKGFMPELDTESAQVQIELPPGARLEDTKRVSGAVADLFRQQPEVASVFEDIGGADARTATQYVNLTKAKTRTLSQKEWENKMAPLLKNFPDVRINFQSQQPGGGGPSGREINIQLTGDDPELLLETVNKIETEMKSLKELRDPRINGDLQRPEIIIKPRFDVAADLGVSIAALGQTIRIATIGDIPQNQAKFSLADRQVPIRVSLVETARTNLATLENIPVPTATGGSVPLKAVADINFGVGPTKIRRYNQARRIVVGADKSPGTPLDAALKSIDGLPTMQNLPQGIKKVDVGQEEFLQELTQGFTLALVSGTFMVFVVLVLLYKRVISPLTNMGSLILAPAGAFFALLITGFEITMPVFIGLLMLFGIVAKNSILLVDFALEEMDRGVDRETAMIDAGHKRAQPIVMTTVAMVAGMLPIAFGLGGDGAFRQPMGIAVIGGLISSTILTLLIVPAAFTCVDDIEKWLSVRLRRLMTSSSEERCQTVPLPAKPLPAK
jgi:hydrophobe/amphiphile efflux-1 (HAE1) family protein